MVFRLIQYSGQGTGSKFLYFLVMVKWLACSYETSWNPAEVNNFSLKIKFKRKKINKKRPRLARLKKF